MLLLHLQLTFQSHKFYRPPRRAKPNTLYSQQLVKRSIIPEFHPTNSFYCYLLRRHG